MSYQKALAKLESLPADEQELASGRYVFSVIDGKPHCGCAIGKLLTEEQRAELVKCREFNLGTVGKLMGWLRVGYDGSVGAGLTYAEAYALQVFNDQRVGESNHETARKGRYRLVIAWLREQVAKETK